MRFGADAVGLPQLVTHSLADYEALACALALDLDRLGEIRGRLAANRLTPPLFGSRRFTRHLEFAFETMWRITISSGCGRFCGIVFTNKHGTSWRMGGPRVLSRTHFITDRYAAHGPTSCL
jgi:hypothetical protein